MKSSYAITEGTTHGSERRSALISATPWKKPRGGSNRMILRAPVSRSLKRWFNWRIIEEAQSPKKLLNKMVATPACNGSLPAHRPILNSSWEFQQTITGSVDRAFRRGTGRGAKHCKAQRGVRTNIAQSCHICSNLQISKEICKHKIKKIKEHKREKKRKTRETELHKNQ